MFDIYISDFMRNGAVITEEELIQTIPSANPGDFKFTTATGSCEMGNAEKFTFTIDPGAKYYDAFLQLKTYVRVVYDGTTIFVGRTLAIENTMRGNRKITCEGPLAYFNDTPVAATTESTRISQSIYSYMSELISNHNNWITSSDFPDKNRWFMLGEVPGNYSEAVSYGQQISNASRKFGSDSWTDTKSTLDDLRSHYGGYFRVRCDHIGGYNYLDWMNYYFNPEVNTQTIEVGKNILDLTTITEVDNIFTNVLAVGTGYSSSSSSSDSDSSSSSSSSSKKIYLEGYSYTDKYGNTRTFPGKYIPVPEICYRYSESDLTFGYHTYEEYQESIARYGWITKIMTFDNGTTQEKLFDEACAWIKNNYQGQVIKFTIKAVDMHQIGENTQKILVGDRVHIRYPIWSEEQNSTVIKELDLTCLSISYDLYHPESNSYTFGIPANVLTKTYGASKQSTSTTSSASSNTSEPTAQEQERDWLDAVKEWLQNHKVFFKHKGSFTTLNAGVLMPYTETQKDKMNGIYGNYKDYLYTKDAFVAGELALWKFSYDYTWKPSDSDERYNTVAKLEEEYEKCQKEYGDYAAKTFKDSHTGKVWKSGTLTAIPYFSSDRVLDFNLIEYCMDEYGIDIRTGLSAKMPSSLTLTDGTVIKTRINEDGDVSISQIIEKNGVTVFMSKDGREITTVMGEDGTYSYWVQDSEGNWVQTNVRNISRDTLDDNRRVGNLFTEYFTDEGGNVVALKTYRFSHEIENYLHGELVVARVEGDLTYLGYGDDEADNKYICAASLQHIDAVAGDIHYETDEEGIKYLYLENAGGVRVRRGYRDENGEWVKDEEGKLILAEFGVYDNNNLTGGIIAEKLGDGTVTTTISGDLINLEANSQFGVITSTVSEQIGVINAQGKKISVFEGSRVWQSRDHIANVCGEYEIIEENGVKRLVILSGGGINIKRNDVEFGLYDQGTLTGGVIVEKINDKETVTKISGDRVEILASNLATFGLVDDDGNFTGGLIAEKLRDGTVTTTISGDIIDINASNLAKFGLVDDDGNFTGGLIAEKLSDGTVTTKISGDIIALSGYAVSESLYACDFEAQSMIANKHCMVKQSLDLEENALIRLGTSSYNKELHAASFTPSETNATENARCLMVNAYISGENNLYIKHLDNKYLSFKFDNANHELEIEDREGNKITFHSYIGGWDACRNSLTVPRTILPSDEDEQGYILVDYPSSIADGDAITYKYLLTATSTKARLGRIINEGKINEEYNVVAEIDIENGGGDFNAGWNAAKTAVGTPPTSTGTTANITVKYPSSTVGTATSYKYTLSTSGKNEVQLRYSTGEESYVAVAKITHNQYNLGWAAARNSIYNKTYTSSGNTYNYFPTTEVSSSIMTSSIRVYMVNSTVDGSASSYTYTLNGDDNNVVYLAYGNKNGPKVAKVTHNKYNAGWNAAKTAVGTPPTSTGTTANITVKYPSSTVGTATSYKYTLSTSGKNEVQLRYSTGEESYVAVAKITHNQYNLGWAAARNSIYNKTYTSSGNTYNYFPTTEVSSSIMTSSIRVYMVNSTVDGSASSYTYTLNGDDNNVVYLAYGNKSGPKVAKVTHNKYNAGWNASRKIVVDNLPLSDIGHATTKSITVRIPKTGGDSTTSAYTYTMSLTDHTPPGGSAYKCIDLTHSGNVVARLDISTDWGNLFNGGFFYGWESYYDSDLWQKPSAANGWQCKIPTRDRSTNELWFDIDAIGYSSSHSINITANNGWYMTGTEQNAKSQAAYAMGTNSGNISSFLLKSSPSNWAWCKVNCGSSTRYILLGC